MINLTLLDKTQIEMGMYAIWDIFSKEMGSKQVPMSIFEKLLELPPLFFNYIVDSMIENRTIIVKIYKDKPATIEMNVMKTPPKYCSVDYQDLKKFLAVLMKQEDQEGVALSEMKLGQIVKGYRAIDVLLAINDMNWEEVFAENTAKIENEGKTEMVKDYYQFYVPYRDMKKEEKVKALFKNKKNVRIITKAEYKKHIDEMV